jgi:hypothetical protein
MSVVFFSGSPRVPLDLHERLYSKIPGRLLSLHPTYLNGADRWLERCEEFDTSNMEVMFDSGAFTAWNQREPAIDVMWVRDQYLDFDELCGGRFKAAHFISLDVIPGVPGRKPTDDEIADAVRRSDVNHAVLKDALGDRVIPVFHQGESAERLAQVQEINPTYICVSPQNQIRETLRYDWARDVHAKLPPNIKTHGLATTGGVMMESIPWRSVDSTTWAIAAGHGSIMIEWEGRLRTFLVDDDRVSKRVDEICEALDITSDMLRDHDTWR